EERLAPGHLLRVRLRPRVDEVQPEPPEEEFPPEARLLPFGLPGGLGHPTGLPLSDGRRAAGGTVGAVGAGGSRRSTVGGGPKHSLDALASSSRLPVHVTLR